MWPLNVPARDFLRLPGASSTAWAVFDADWYRTSYPSATSHLAGAGSEAVLEFYFECGQGLGHSPNMLFDEAWHRQAYPGIAALVEAGEFPSAFDAWCRGGCHERSPHWLFDELEYRRRNPDLTDALLSRNGLVNGYAHYLWRGSSEGRIAHPMFDPAVYRAGLDPDAAGEAAVDGPFWHCLRRMHRGEPEVRTSPYFDPAWYARRYPAVGEAIGRGVWRWSIEHYLCNATPTQFDPLPVFSEDYYLARYDDAAGMVRRGEIRNGFGHFLRHGAPETRSPSETLNLAEYAASPDVRRELDRIPGLDAFTHWLTVGHGLAAVLASDEPVTEAEATTLSRRRARALSVLHARTGLDFTTKGAPALSVLMVLRNQFELTMMTLGSLRGNHPEDIDLVLIDSGSTDETRDIQRYVHGATHFQFDTNIGLLPARNAAAQFATGDIALFLDNAAELAPGAIAAALRRLRTDQRVGAVGGMIIRADGLIQAAGNMLCRDGSTLEYGHDATPLAPEVNFTRDVEFCSAVFLMTRRALLNELEGFDTEFGSVTENAGLSGATPERALAGHDFDAADLCLRIRQAGYRVVYDPAVVVHRPRFAGAGERATAEAARGRELLARKHARYLAARPLRDDRRQVFDRVVDPARRRVLFVEDTIPLRMIGSGFVRSNDIVREMATIGYAVTIYPLNGSTFDIAGVYADMPDGVEVIHDGTLERFEAFLTRRRDYYGIVWAARTHNITTVRSALERTHGGSGRIPPVVLDTEALASVREAGQAAIEGRPFDFDDAVASELRDASFCETIVAINQTEATILRELGFTDVAVIGHMREVHATPRPFSGRAGMLFVGAIHRMDSPNYDGLCWFVDEVLPIVARELTWETRLTIVGHTGEGVSLERFREHPRVTLRGMVADLEPLYDLHRVFVAPTRIAAGTPYKVHEAASFGLPVVATELLRHQLDWTDGRDLLAAGSHDPAAFARHVIALQRDETLWHTLRDSALARVRQENNREDYAAAIRRVLGPPRSAA